MYLISKSSLNSGKYIASKTFHFVTVQLHIVMLVHKSYVVKILSSELARHGEVISVGMLQKSSGLDVT